MKKMMFNDHYGLTDAVIKRRKQQTRRTLKNQSGNLAGQIKYTKKGCDLVFVRADFDNGISEDCPYAIGEIIAVAQCYNDIVKNDTHFQTVLVGNDILGSEPACSNKMFVKAKLMPHQIRILDVRAERLQDITEEDCFEEYPKIQEKIDRHYKNVVSIGGRIENNILTPKQIFAWLINKISGKGTWNANPYVWRIKFELIK